MMKKTLFVLAAASLLSACGFTPVHAPAMGANAAAFKNIRVETIPPSKGNEIDKEAEFWVKQRLRDRLGNEGSSKHILEVQPNLSSRRLGISGDDIATRYDIIINAKYKLIDAASGDVLDEGKVTSVSTFGAPGDAYGRTAAEKNATRTVASETADRLLHKLASYYANTP